MRAEELEGYWDHVALEARGVESERIRKWKTAARNWLAEYADKRAKDFVLSIAENVLKSAGSTRVLDIGCGPGKWTRLFAERRSRVTAVDVSPKMIVLAKESISKENLTRVDFHVMSVSRLRLPDNAYDLVNCVTVLQHVLDDEEWKSAVKELVRVTKPSGKILLYETAPSLTIKKRTAHLRLNTMKSYANEFKKAGARLIYWRAVDLSLPITFFGLKKYAASFNKQVYYFLAGRFSLFSPRSLSLLSKIAVILARLIDYRFGGTPLGFLSVGKIMLFEKNV